MCLFFFKLLKKGYLPTILKYSTKGKWRATWSNIAFLKRTRSLRHYKVRIPFFKKIQDWILKSKNGICASFLNRSIQDFSDHDESRWSQRNRRIQSGSRFFVVYETRTMTPTNFLYFHCIFIPGTFLEKFCLMNTSHEQLRIKLVKYKVILALG